MPHPIRELIAQGRLCRSLRTKGMFVFGDEGPPADHPHPPDTAVFWCERSGWALGPDLGPADDRSCAAGCGRRCFSADATA